MSVLVNTMMTMIFNGCCVAFNLKSASASRCAFLLAIPLRTGYTCDLSFGRFTMFMYDFRRCLSGNLPFARVVHRVI